MENDLEHDIRHLAYHIWQTAGREFGQTALDFWAMAERMVIELTADSARRANAAAASAFENVTTWPSALRALYLYRVRELARCMWLSSAEQHERSMDYWLAAEKHLRLLTESTARAAGASLGREEALAKTFETFSPADYLEQIRKAAYQLWETAESQHNSALDFWLAAENRIMESFTASRPTTGAGRHSTNQGAPTMSGPKIDKAKGKIKEAIGQVTGDKQLEAEGQVEQVSATVREKAAAIKADVAEAFARAGAVAANIKDKVKGKD